MIRGVDYADIVDYESVTATNNVNPRQDSMSFTMHFLDGETRATPRAGMEVVWGRYDATSGVEIEREYAGIITTVEETDEYYPALTYHVRCKPYTRWFDRRNVRGFTQQDKAENVLKSLIAQYAPDFDTTNVVAPPVIVSQYFNYQKLSKAVTLICDQIGYAWYLDHYKKVHVFRSESFKSPLPNNILDIDGDRASYGDLVLTEDSEEVYNHFTLRGFKIADKNFITFNYVADGTSNQWVLGYRISSAKGHVKVWVGGVEYEVKRDVIEGVPGQGGEPNVAYVHYTQHLVRLASAPPAGTLIRVDAIPLKDRVYSNVDQRSVSYMKNLEQTTDGVYEYAELDKSLSQSTMGAVKTKVELLAYKHGMPTITGTFTSFISGWRAGQSFQAFSVRRMGGILDPASANYRKDVKFYVYRVTKRWIAPNHDAATKIAYAIEIADRPNFV